MGGGTYTLVHSPQDAALEEQKLNSSAFPVRNSSRSEFLNKSGNIPQSSAKSRPEKLKNKNEIRKRLPPAIVISRSFSISRNSSRIPIGILERQMNSDKSFEHLGETSRVKWDHRVYICTDTIFFNSRRSCSMVQRRQLDVNI